MESRGSGVVRVALGCLAPLLAPGAFAAAGAGCADGATSYDGFHYEQRAGFPIDADFAQLVPIIEAQAADGKTRRFLVDSGAPFTILNRAQYATLGLGDGVHKVDVDAFDLVFPSYPVVEYAAFDSSASDPTAIAGLLGGDLLRHFAYSLDYHDARIWLSDPFDPANLPPGLDVDPEVALLMDVRGGGLSLAPGDCHPEPNCGTIDVPPTRVLVQAFFEGETTPRTVLIDSGATAVVLDDQLFATLDGKSMGRPRLGGLTVQTATGIKSGFLSRLSSLSLTNASGAADKRVVLDDLPVLIVPGFTLLSSLQAEVGVPIDALVGGTALRRFFTTLDYPSNLLRLSKYKDTSHIPAREFVGLGIVMASSAGTWVVQTVYTGHDAEAQGVVPGDVVEEISGMPIAGQSGRVVDDLIGAYDVGQRAAVGFRGSNGVETKMILVENLLPDYPAP